MAIVSENPVIAIHQPEHFPYMGFFQKMAKSDIFVILDNVNFRKNYFQNRNNFPNKQGQLEWFTIPVPSEAPKKRIKDVKVSELPNNWRKQLNRKIQLNLGIDISYIYESDSLIEINMRSIRWAMDRLNLDVPIVYASDLNVEGSKSALLANICRHLNASKYISGPSGRDYLDMSLFEGFEVEFHHVEVENYYSSLYNLK